MEAATTVIGLPLFVNFVGFSCIYVWAGLVGPGYKQNDDTTLPTHMNFRKLVALNCFYLLSVPVYYSLLYPLP